MNEQKEYELGQLLAYEQPTPYIVESTKYNDEYTTPVLTAGKTFILGYTNEEFGIYDALPVIIFDDFTTASRFVNFKFKVKSSAMKILTPNTELVDPKYIYYRMQIIEYDHSTHKRYWISQYSKIKISIPPIPEQKRIVAYIEEQLSQLDNGVETLEKTKQQLEVYQQAVYSSAYSNDTMLPITNFFDVSGGLTKNPRRDTLKIKMPYLRVANVYYNMLVLDEIKNIGVSESEISKTLLKKGDLLFVEGNGSKDQIGRVAIWDGSIENCLHQNHLIKARPLGGMLPQYALYYLISSHGRNQILKVASSTSGLYTLSTNKVRNLKIPFVPLPKQRNIVDEIDSRISTCAFIERNIDTALQQADALRRSILKKAFEESI